MAAVACPAIPGRGRTGRARLAGDRMPSLPPRLPNASAWRGAGPADARQGVRVRRVNAFHVLGGLLAVWALLVSFLGITRENWPTSKGTERAVIFISVALFICAVGSAVLTAVEEHNEKKHEESGEEHALALPF